MKAHLTTGDVARAFGVTINTVKAWIRAGTLEAVRLPSGHFRIPARELERLREQGRVESLRRAFVQRRRNWVAMEEWRLAQPVEERPLGELLTWVGEMLAFATQFGPVPERPVEEKIAGVRELHRALEHVRW